MRERDGRGKRVVYCVVCVSERGWQGGEGGREKMRGGGEKGEGGTRPSRGAGVATAARGG